MMNWRTLAVIGWVFINSGWCPAEILDFEDFAAPGTIVNVSPSTPYTEDGFTITPSTDASAVFDAAATRRMIGNNTDWFGFGESNSPSLTLAAATGSFDLGHLLLGPSTIALSSSISVSMLGIHLDGSSVTHSFTNLTTATTAFLGWTNLTRVVFMASDDAGFDDIHVTPVPEPLSLIFWSILAVSSSGCWRRR